MSVSCFTSTNSHLCKFLRTTGRDWRNTIYIECGDCQRAVSRGCKNLLCAFDTASGRFYMIHHFFRMHNITYTIG